jgi:hypothetical protein
MDKKLIIFLLLLTAAAASLVYPLTEEGTINGEQYVKKVPLYVKACGLIYRGWMYRDLAREITEKKTGDLDKTIAIFDWVSNNIVPDVPAGLKVVDDYSYNAVIRQYGTREQVNEVFAILCLTSGIQAGWDRCYNADKSESVIFAFALVGGRWLIFDVVRHKYFLNRQGGIMSVHDYLRDDAALSASDAVAYKEYLDDIKDMYGEISQEVERPLGRFGQFVGWIKEAISMRKKGK